MTWQDTSLGAHIDLISGPAFKSRNFTDDPSDVPLVKGENIGQGEIIWSASKYWPSHRADEFARFRLKPGDVILAMDRPWVTAGLKYAWVKEGDPDALLVQRVARMRGTNGLLTGFLRYVVASKAFSDYIKNIMGGTNVPHISGDQIRAFKFRLPDPGSQHFTKGKSE
jgi:type I restriction enzyme S subunit